MAWYTAKIIFRIICGSGKHTPQFDEQFRLVDAPDEKNALLKASLIGEDQQDCFLNNKQQTVKWEFIAVTELYRLGELSDGAEIFSQIEEHPDANSHIELIQRQSAKLHRIDTRHC